MTSSYLASIQAVTLCTVIVAVLAVSYSVYGHVDVIMTAGIGLFVAAGLGFDWGHQEGSTITQALLSVV